jgi:sporulation protein YlmC with PRC-barrel domain
MAKHLFYGMVIAATALTSVPVMAQTTAATNPSTVTSPATRPSTTMTSPSTTTADTSTSSTPTYYTADHQLRSSKLVGASVYNGQNQSIGSINDILLSDNSHKADMAVISVGGFLGIGSKWVSVPFDQLKIQDNKVVMPNATKASLESMPGYSYSKS